MDLPADKAVATLRDRSLLFAFADKPLSTDETESLVTEVNILGPVFPVGRRRKPQGSSLSLGKLRVLRELTSSVVKL